jgi:hypothetical protein
MPCGIKERKVAMTSGTKRVTINVGGLCANHVSSKQLCTKTQKTKHIIICERFTKKKVLPRGESSIKGGASA